MLQRWGARRLGWLLAAAALCGGVVWLAALPLSEQQGGAVTSAGTARSRTLPDRSTLALAEHTEARVVRLEPGEVRVQLARGSVECEVAHDPARRFVVAVGGLEVVVKGTHFTVSAGVPAPGQPAIAVSVERGRVEVRQPDRVLALLGPGQCWSNQASDSAPSELPPAEPPPVPPAAVEPSTPAPAAAPRPPPAPRARQRFERAEAERVAGRSRRAAAAFDELRQRYPADPLAGYAAFLLGRIRLDALGDPSGAAEAFEFALAHPGSGFFLEDAAARRVEALDRAGRASECRAARERFLREHPDAVRAPAVVRLCGER